MRKLFSVLVVLFVLSLCLSSSLGQRRRHQRKAIVGGIAGGGKGAGVGSKKGAAIGAGGAGTYSRRRHRRRVGTSTRGVVEREQLELRKHRRRH